MIVLTVLCERFTERSHILDVQELDKDLYLLLLRVRLSRLLKMSAKIQTLGTDY